MRKQDELSKIWSSARGLRTFGHCSIVFAGLLLSGLLAACSDSSSSEFPPVKLEFATAFANELGEVDEMRLDDGRLLPLDKHVLASDLTEGDSVRVVSYYQVNDQEQIEVRSMRLAETVVPAVVADASLNAPVELMSASQGLYHLNLVLGVQNTDAEKQFRVHPVFYEARPPAQSTLHLYLYYDTENYRKTYTERVYMSIPMSDFLSDFTPDFEIVLHWQDVNNDAEQTLTVYWR